MASPSEVPKTAEVVIVGGGIVGLSLAFFLAEHGAGSIVVLDRQEIASGATAKATGGIRQQFTSEPQIRLSVESVRFYERFAEIVGRPFPFRQVGYLFLLPDERRLATFRQAVELQTRHGAPSEVLTAEEVVRLWPALHVDGYAGATFCPTDGVGPPADAAYALAGRARELGVTIVEGTGVTNISAANGRVTGVETTRGRIAAPVVVNAAGPWAAEIGRLAGVTLPVTAHPRQVFTLSPLEELGDAFPFTVDMAAGVYVHQEPGTLLLGGGDGDEPARPPSDVPPPLDWSRFEATATAATRWLPALAETESRGGWRGFREMTPDHLPILGPTPGLDGFWLAVGFSGHGFMHAPAVGRALADWITTGRSVDLDEEAFSPARFGANEGVGDGAVF